MNLTPDQWNAIRAHYLESHEEIMSAGANEWGIDAYMWTNLPIRLTPIEEWLWADIRACNAVLYPQYPVGRFFVDFANPCAKVAIECDGAAFHQDKAKDAARDAELMEMGWTVYRISGSDCRKDFDEETHHSSSAYKFIESICENHGISRNSRTRAQAESTDQRTKS